MLQMRCNNFYGYCSRVCSSNFIEDWRIPKRANYETPDLEYLTDSLSHELTFLFKGQLEIIGISYRFCWKRMSVNLKVNVVNTQVASHDELLRILSILDDLVDIASRNRLLNNFDEIKLSFQFYLHDKCNFRPEI